MLLLLGVGRSRYQLRFHGLVKTLFSCLAVHSFKTVDGEPALSDEWERCAYKTQKPGPKPGFW